MKRTIIGLLLLLAAGRGAEAQVSPAAAPPSRGVTVVGHGSVSVPPDRARLVVRLFANQRPGTPAGSLDEAGKTIANALRTAGVRDAAYVLPLAGTIGPGSSPAVVGTVSKPTRESAERMTRDVFANLPESLPGVVSFQITSALIVDDCSAAEARAQTAAIADARARAERAASAAGLRLGAIESVNESMTFPSPGCGAPNGAPLGFNGGQDEYGPLAVVVSVTATVTFGLR